MPKKKLIAIVDERRELLEFLKDQLTRRGYQVAACLTEEEADALEPAPDVIMVDFEEFGIDLDEVVKVIEGELQGVDGAQ